MKPEPQPSLIVKRTIPATPERLFRAWTTPSELQAWWGPRGVRCSHAEVDARVGGRYQLDNQLPDGSVVVIRGEFLNVRPPHELAFTWVVERAGQVAPGEHVCVRFEACAAGTEVVVTHERITDAQVRETHALGWDGCLAGLALHASGAPL